MAGNSACFVGGAIAPIVGGSAQRRARRVCVRQEGEDGGVPGESAKEKRERLAREREERIREKRRQRQMELDMKEGVVNVADVAGSEDGKVMPDGNYGENAEGLFGWVNQNPSSKNAVIMPAFKGDGGNTGEMAQRIRGRGMTEEGSEIEIELPKKTLNIYVRKVGTPKSNLPPIVMVHGLLANSWCYKELLNDLETNDREAYAFDFPGSGYSSWPQPGLGFNFSESELTEVIVKVLDQLDLGSREVIMVTQGYIYSQYANLWALENPQRVSKLVLLNQPLLPNSGLPFLLQQYRTPLVAPFVAQDSLRAERFLEGGGPYQMNVQDSDRYREAYLESMMPGLALIDAVSKINFGSAMKRTFEGAKKSADKIAVVWGTADKYLKVAEAEDFCKQTGAKLKKIDNAGFLVQSDWAPRVGDFLRTL